MVADYTELRYSEYEQPDHSFYAPDYFADVKDHEWPEALSDRHRPASLAYVSPYKYEQQFEQLTVSTIRG